MIKYVHIKINHQLYIREKLWIMLANCNMEDSEEKFYGYLKNLQATYRENSGTHTLCLPDDMAAVVVIQGVETRTVDSALGTYTWATSMQPRKVLLR